MSAKTRDQFQRSYQTYLIALSNVERADAQRQIAQRVNPDAVAEREATLGKALALLDSASWWLKKGIQKHTASERATFKRRLRAARKGAAK